MIDEEVNRGNDGKTASKSELALNWKAENCALLLKGSDLGGSAGQGFPTARLAIQGTVCALPTFTLPMNAVCVPVKLGSLFIWTVTAV